MRTENHWSEVLIIEIYEIMINKTFLSKIFSAKFFFIKKQCGIRWDQIC